MGDLLMEIFAHFSHHPLDFLVHLFLEEIKVVKALNMASYIKINATVNFVYPDLSHVNPDMV